MKSKAPSFVARTAVSIVPCPLIMITGSARPAPARSSSSTRRRRGPGIAMSSSTRSGRPLARSRASAASPSRAAAVVEALVGEDPGERAPDARPRRRRSGSGSTSAPGALRRDGAAIGVVPRDRQLDDEARAARLGSRARGRSRGGRRRCATRSRGRARCRGPWSRSTARRCGGGPRRDADAVVGDLDPHASGAARRARVRSATRPRGSAACSSRRLTAATALSSRLVSSAAHLLAVEVDGRQRRGRGRSRSATSSVPA